MAVGMISAGRERCEGASARGARGGLVAREGRARGGGAEHHATEAAPSDTK